MKKISAEAGLSTEYVNHDIRTTACVVLDEGNYNPREITALSGHKDERSLKSYIAKPPLQKRKDISHTLHKFEKSKKLRGNKENCSPNVQPKSPAQPLPPQAPPTSISTHTHAHPSNQGC